MKEFMQEFPKFDKDIIFKARDKYLQSFNGNYTYMEQADYFIKKTITEDGKRTIRRTLLQYCEEVYLLEVVKLDKSIDSTIVSGYDDI